MTDQYTKLRDALAAGPTPGPWSVAEESFDNEGIPESVIRGLDGRAAIAVALEFGENNPLMRQANANMIAAANPAAVSTLLAERDAQAAEIERLREALELIVSDHDFCGDDWGSRRDAWIETARAALSQGEPNASDPTAHG